MEICFTAETEAKLENLTQLYGSGTTAEFVRSVVEDYVRDTEDLGATLTRRYDEIASGNAVTVSLADVRRHFADKSQAFRQSVR